MRGTWRECVGQVYAGGKQRGQGEVAQGGEEVVLEPDLFTGLDGEDEQSAGS